MVNFRLQLWNILDSNLGLKIWGTVQLINCTWLILCNAPVAARAVSGSFVFCSTIINDGMTCRWLINCTFAGSRFENWCRTYSSVNFQNIIIFYTSLTCDACWTTTVSLSFKNWISFGMPVARPSSSWKSNICCICCAACCWLLPGAACCWDWLKSGMCSENSETIADSSECPEMTDGVWDVAPRKTYIFTRTTPC